jgi:hypothetical protein
MIKHQGPITEGSSSPFGHWDLVIGHSFFIRHSNFVIPFLYS